MAYKTVKAGQVHGAGGGDTLSLFPRDSVLHGLKNPFHVWVWLSACKRPISFPATSGEYSHPSPHLGFHTRAPRKDVWSQMMANTRQKNLLENFILLVPKSVYLTKVSP